MIPEHCIDMAEVRAGVDDVDRQILALLQRRFQFMEAAARIKKERSAVRDEARKAEVLAKVMAMAQDAGLDCTLVARLYEALIEESISYELKEFDRLRACQRG